MAYNTGNAPGSTHPKDLDDNAEDLDLLMTNPAAWQLNRLGVALKSWKGMEGEHDADQIRREAEFDADQTRRESEFDADQARHESEHDADQARRESEFDVDQDNREVQFNTFMDASGLEPPIPYAPGILLDRTTKTVSYLGNEYRAKGSFIPMTTSTWAVDEAKLKLIGDDSLRQSMADPAVAARLMAYLNPATGAATGDVFNKLRWGSRNIEEFYWPTDPVGDYTLATQRAVDWANSVYLAAPTYRSIAVLYNPAFSYTLDAAAVILKSGVTLVGSPGRYAGARLYLKKSNGFGIDTGAGTVNFAGVVGFKIEGDNTAVNNGGLRVQLGHECVFSDLVFLNFQNQGFVYGGGAACEFSRIFADQCVLNRARAAPIAAVEIFGTDGQIIDIEGSAGITIGMGRSSSDLFVKGIWIGGSTHFVSNCVGEFADVGMYITASTSIFIANRSDLCQGPGWQMVGGQNRMVACIALNNSQHQDGLYPGFSTVGTASKGNKYSMCRALSATAKRHNYGYVDETTSATAGPSEYSMCDSSGQALKKYSLAANSSSIINFPTGGIPRTIPDNVGVPDVTDYANFYSTNSVAATYTNFSGGESGQRVNIIATNANCRIANNANIITVAGANLTLATNQAVTFLECGGFWRQV